MACDRGALLDTAVEVSSRDATVYFGKHTGERIFAEHWATGKQVRMRVMVSDALIPSPHASDARTCECRELRVLVRLRPFYFRLALVQDLNTLRDSEGLHH